MFIKTLKYHLQVPFSHGNHQLNLLEHLEDPQMYSTGTQPLLFRCRKIFKDDLDLVFTDLFFTELEEKPMLILALELAGLDSSSCQHAWLQVIYL